MKKEKLSSLLISLESGGRAKGGAISEGIPSIGAEHLNNDGTIKTNVKKFISVDYFNSMKSGIISKGNILIVKDGATTGKVSFVDRNYPFEKSAVNEHVFLLNVNEKIAYPKYVFNYLRSADGQKEILSDFRGATVGGISRRIGNLVKVPLPPLSDQIRIAEILSQAESLIAQRKQSIGLLDELLKSTFLEMFGAYFNGKIFDTLNNLCTKVTDGTHDTPKRLTEGIKFITGKHIRPFAIDYENSDYVTKEVHDEIYKRCNPEFGDVLYTNIGVNLGTAATNVVKYEFSMKNVALLKLRRDIVNPRYIEHLLNNERQKNRIISDNSSGGAQKFLSLGQIKSIKIPVPPAELQTKFARIVEKVEALKTQNQQSLVELQNMYGVLSQRAFKGGLNYDSYDLCDSKDSKLSKNKKEKI